MQFSQQQQAVIDSWGQGLAVLAGAGSGKTTTLVQKCRVLLARKSGARFAAVSFTEKSAADLQAKLATVVPMVEEDGSSGGHWVKTIHGLCRSVIKDFAKEAGFDGEEQILGEADARLLWERALERLWFGEPPVPVQKAVSELLKRESRLGIDRLVERVKSLRSFGVLERFDVKDGDAQSLKIISEYVLRIYDQSKTRRGVIDFDDLELGAERALQFERVRRAYWQRFDLVLVDEFQDTNPTQARIVWGFVRPDQSNLVVVGDPKQSIYRFRDADVSLFEELCSRLPIQLTLANNYRSRAGIIHFVNRVCDPLFKASDLRYDALGVTRKDTDQPPVVRLNVENPADLGRWIRQQHVPLQDFALLLRRIRGNEKWLKGLTATGIPLAVASGGLFWEDPRVREMVALLRAWDDRGNRLSAAVFLRAPWVGVADEWIDRQVREGNDLLGTFLATDHPLARSLRSLSAVLRPGELLLALLINDDVEAELGAPCLGLWHRVEDLSASGLGFHAVVKQLSKSVELGRREREVPPPSNEGVLTVLTIHGSKGLEFPHVILVDLAGKMRGAPAPLLFWDRHEGAALGGRKANGDRDKALESPWRKREAENNLAEAKRLFYVALTRASDRLILTFPAVEDYPRKDVTIADDWRGWIEELGGELKCQAAGEMKPGSKPRTTGLVERSRWKNPQKVRRPRHSVTEWNQLARCPQAYEWQYIRPNIRGLRTAEPVERGRGVSQRELGTLIHAGLEKFEQEGNLDSLREVYDVEALETWAKNSELMQAGSPTRQVWRELAFELPVGQEVVVGSIDRLVRQNDRYQVIDFKVTAKKKSAAELFDAYRMQMMIYALAVQRLEDLALEQIEVKIVNITRDLVQVHAVPLPPRLDQLIEKLAAQAHAIVNGTSGRPRVNALCQNCDYRLDCSAFSQKPVQTTLAEFL